MGPTTSPDQLEILERANQFLDESGSFGIGRGADVTAGFVLVSGLDALGAIRTTNTVRDTLNRVIARATELDAGA